MVGGGEPSRRGTLADFGLVGLVVGAAVSFILGMVSIGAVALLGRIPLPIGLLFVLASLVTVFGLVVTIATVRRGNTDQPGPEDY